MFFNLKKKLFRGGTVTNLSTVRNLSGQDNKLKNLTVRFTLAIIIFKHSDIVFVLNCSQLHSHFGKEKKL